MATTLFENTNFRGTSLLVNNDRDTLRGTSLGNNPRSMKMTSDDDAILLCNKSNWNGEVWYLRGQREISDLNDPEAGGNRGIGNSITSFRVKPFTVKVNITIVTGDNGELPGKWSTRDDVQNDVNTMISMANDFYEEQKALLKVSLADLTFRADEKRFRMAAKEWGSIPASWKVAHAVDIVFPDTIEDAVGLGSFPWHGKFCLVAAERNSVEEMARTFVHELGHFWGLTHENDNPPNIMAQSKFGKPLTQSRLRDGQIQEIQQKLARNLSRQGDRVE